MKKNIVITHGYSDSNKGDLAITQAIFNGLKLVFPNSKITLLSTIRENDPDFWYHNRKMKENDINIEQGILPTPYIGGKSSLLINMQAVLRLIKDIIQLKISYTFLGKYFGGKHYKAIKTIRSADFVVVKGGQFIYNDKEDLRGNLFMWRTLQPIKVAKKLNKKVIIFSQSIGGFASKKSEKRAMKYLALCDRVIVREQLSYNLLKKYNIPNVSLKPDAAFFINESTLDTNFINDISNNILGITVVNWSFPEKNDVNKAKQEYVNNLVYAIEKSVKKHNLTPMFIPQVTVKHHNKSDTQLMHKIGDILEKKGIKSIFIEKDYNAEEMVSIYKKCKLLIGTRLHSCILAAVASTPVIAIRYQGFKTQGVMEMLGYSNFVHDINQLDGDKLFNDISTVVEENHKISSNIKAKVNLLRSDLNKAFNSLKDL